MTVQKQGILKPIVLLAGGQVGDNGTTAKKFAITANEVQKA